MFTTSQRISFQNYKNTILSYKYGIGMFPINIQILLENKTEENLSEFISELAKNYGFENIHHDNEYWFEYIPIEFIELTNIEIARKKQQKLDNEKIEELTYSNKWLTETQEVLFETLNKNNKSFNNIRKQFTIMKQKIEELEKYQIEIQDVLDEDDNNFVCDSVPIVRQTCDNVPIVRLRQAAMNMPVNTFIDYGLSHEFQQSFDPNTSAVSEKVYHSIIDSTVDNNFVYDDHSEQLNDFDLEFDLEKQETQPFKHLYPPYDCDAYLYR